MPRTPRRMWQSIRDIQGHPDPPEKSGRFSGSRQNSLSIIFHGQNPRFAGDKIQQLPNCDAIICKNPDVGIYMNYVMNLYMN